MAFAMQIYNSWQFLCSFASGKLYAEIYPSGSPPAMDLLLLGYLKEVLGGKLAPKNSSMILDPKLNKLIQKQTPVPKAIQVMPLVIGMSLQGILSIYSCKIIYKIIKSF
jgi:hypothetical protein